MAKIDYLLSGFAEIKLDPSNLEKAFTVFLRFGIRASLKNKAMVIVLHSQIEDAKRILNDANIPYNVSRIHRIIPSYETPMRAVIISSALILTAVLVAFLSNIVWCVDVSGNENVSASSIISGLEECGLSVGKIWGKIDLGEIETAFLKERQDVGWININRSGTVAYVTVKESDMGAEEKPEAPEYSNVVAKEDCVIESISVKSGTAVVKVGDAVTKGDTLILGVISQGDVSALCQAEGEVIGRVNCAVNASVLREKTKRSLKSTEICSLRIKIFNFLINIFKKYGNLDNDCDIIEEKHQISLNDGRKLPLEVIKEYRVEYTDEYYSATDEDLVREASAKMTVLVNNKLRGVDLNSIKTYGRFTDEGYEMTSLLIYSCSVSETVEFFVDEKTRSSMAEKIVLTNSNESTSAIFGAFDSNVRKIENAFDVRISNRNTNSDTGDAIVITGDSDGAEKARKTLEYLKRMSGAGETIGEESVEYVIGLAKDGTEDIPENFSNDVICVTNRGKPIKAKTLGQKKYIDVIKKNTIVLGLGPAGPGKTFLAVAMAVEALRNKSVSRIILTRPAVEAGERLGFLPGDLQSKIDPYLRPLYDALFEMLGPENYARHMERGTIEIAPLAYMRGRTLDDSFIILDEAQNTTMEQMKMFLTRLGYNSKAVVTGDLSQTDLPFGKKSGLSVASKILENIEGIGIFRFTDRDVVRHHLVRKIINAYDTYEREANAKKFTAEPKNRKGNNKNVQ